MSGDLGRMIAEVLEGTGAGIEKLRLHGSGVGLQDCTIEVVFDDPAEPAAQLRIVLGSGSGPDPPAQPE